MLDAIVSPAQRSFEYHPHWHDGEQMGAFKDTEGDYFFAWFCAHGAVIRGFAHGSLEQPPIDCSEARKSRSTGDVSFEPRHAHSCRQALGHFDTGNRRLPLVSTSHDSPSRFLAAIWDGLPSPLAYAKTEPAFGGEDVTFACWAPAPPGSTAPGSWHAGKVKVPKGRDPDGSEELLFGCFSSNVHQWVENYYDQVIPKEALADLWRPGVVLVGATLTAVNRNFDLKAVREEAAALDWPIDISETLETSSPPPAATRAKGIPSFGNAEFVVRCERDRTVMLIHGKRVIAEAKVNVYEELFDLVRSRLLAASKG